MPIIPAICTQCGAQIEVDNTHETGICNHCGTAFITEKVINAYTTNITNHNHFVGATVHMNVDNELEQLISAAEGFQRLGDKPQAYETYQKITQKFPQDIRGWIGILHTYEDGEIINQVPSLWDTNLFNNNNTLKKAFENAYILADSNTKKQLELTKENYENAVKLKWVQFRKKCSLEDLKNFIGNHMYMIRFINEVLFQKMHVLFVRDNILYYQYTEVYTSASDGNTTVSNVKVYEVSSMDNNGTICAKHIYGAYEDELLKVHHYYKNEDRAYICMCGNEHQYSTILEPSDRNYSYIINGWEAEKREKEKRKEQEKKKNGCYIATCVYGSYECPQVWTLRRFRDFTLDTTWYGRLFIKFYYAISPILVKWFGNQVWFQTFWKNHLDNMVSTLNNIGYKNTRYTDKY